MAAGQIYFQWLPLLGPCRALEMTALTPSLLPLLWRWSDFHALPCVLSNEIQRGWLATVKQALTPSLLPLLWRWSGFHALPCVLSNEIQRGWLATVKQALTPSLLPLLWRWSGFHALPCVLSNEIQRGWLATVKQAPCRLIIGLLFGVLIYLPTRNYCYNRNYKFGVRCTSRTFQLFHPVLQTLSDFDGLYTVSG